MMTHHDDYSAEQTLSQILHIAQGIEADSHPQAVIDLLHEHVMGAHVGAIMMMQYGPQGEDISKRPYDYLEMSGSWSKRYGSGVGMGIRFSIGRYQSLIASAERSGELVLSNTREIRRSFDPLVRGLMRAAMLRSLAFFPLGMGDRKLGVILIGTNRPHTFSDAELRHYRAIFEMLSISLRAQLLRQQRDRVQNGRAALLDAVTDGVVMVVPGSGRGGRVLTVNARFTSMFGVTESAAGGRSLIEMIGMMHLPERVRDELRRAWLSSPMQDPATLAGDFRMIGDDGREHEFAWYSAPVYQVNQVLGRIFTVHDVTAEKTAARLRAGFVSRVSHELRTPLTSIQGFAEFILTATGDQLPPVAREYTQIIYDSARHLTRVFSDLIEITRADVGELQLHKERTSAARIIQDVAARLRLTVAKRRQTLELVLDEKMPHTYIDSDRMIQILTNLISNASKYAPEDTPITVRLRYLRAEDPRPVGCPSDVLFPTALITIEDQGIGVAAEDVEQIFVPFFRSEEARKGKIEGVGLGLSVTRSLVEMHQGKIWAVPREVAGGGCFQFTIPVKE